VGIWKDVSYEFYTPNVSISLESFSIRNSDVTRNSTTVQINITTEWTLDPKTPTSYSVVIANGSTVVASKI
jgi:phage antirepressor YoqD-like protein